MSTTTNIVVAVVAAWVGFSAYAVITHQSWVVDNLAAYGVPRDWWPWLGTAKTLGAAGLVAGIWQPEVGLIAAIGLALYFVGAMTTVLHAHAYRHVVFPLLYLTPVVASGILIANS